MATRWINALDRPTDFARARVELVMDYPMWLMPAEELVNLRGPLQPHHELVKSGKLVKWEEGRKRKVVLISHQWAGKRHPDPYMDQISVLQDLLLEMAAGRVKVRKDLIAEMMGSNVALPSEEEQHRCMEWDIWYDFFGIPQVDDRGCVACIPELQAAVDSIPAYCDAADYVIILAPTVKHADTGALMNYATWGTRGWCRVERTATALSAKEKPLLVVTKANSIFPSSGAEWIQSWPHDGDFTVEEDRQTVETLTKQLLELKCAYMLQSGDMHRWRFYKALTAKILRARAVRPSQRKSLSEGFQKQEIIDSFQVNYHFNSIYFNEGLTSLMLACIEGCTQTVQLLIDSKAEVNATWKGSIREVQLEGTHTALSISAAFSTSEVAACLLNAGAKHDASRDNQGNSLIGIAALFGNYEVIPVLADMGMDIHRANLRGDSPMICAVLTQNPQVVKTLADLRADPNQKSTLGQSPLSISVLQGLERHAAYLLEAQADPNVQPSTWAATDRSAQVRRLETLSDFTIRTIDSSRKSSRNSTNQIRSVLSVLSGGTPLQVAAMNGNWPLVQLLLRWKADPSKTTPSVQSTALELAEDYGHSDLLMRLTGAIASVDYFYT